MMSDYYEDDAKIICSACQCELEGEAERQAHYSLDWHIYNVKRKTADLPPIPYQLFHEKYEIVRKMKEADEKASEGIVCPITNRKFRTRNAYEHFKSTKEYARQYDRYLERLQKQQQNGETGDEQQQPLKSKHHIEYVLPDPEDDVVTENDQLLIEYDKIEAEREKQEAEEDEEAEVEAEVENEAETEAADGDDEDEDYEEEEGQVMIPLKYSLFDNIGPFKTVRASVNYMIKKYNFHLPYFNFLIDLEGLLEYLGAKIGIGHMCIQCNRRFETTIGCQHHMISQGHCSFTLDSIIKGDKAEGEQFVFDFYDFSHNLEADTYTPEEKKQRQAMRLRTLIVLGIKSLDEVNQQQEEGVDVLSTVMTVPTQHEVSLSDIDDDGNILLSDGTILGTRHQKHEFKQKRAMVYYDKKESALIEAKQFNVSTFTEEKREEVKQLKAHQKYIRRQHLRVGLQKNHIMKEYFRKQNQQNN